MMISIKKTIFNPLIPLFTDTHRAPHLTYCRPIHYNPLRLFMDIEEIHNPHQVFEFRRAQGTANRLVNKKLNIVEVDQKLNTVECKDTENDPTVTRAEHSLNLEGSASYFEIEVLGATEEDTINVGLMSKDSNNKLFLGKSVNSFGYLKGDLYLDKKKASQLTLPEKLKVGDRIGIGINCHRRTFFVVKNEIVMQRGIDIPPAWNEFIPAVALSNQHEKVQFHFDVGKFRFKFNDYSRTIQVQLEKEIQSSNHFTNSQIYSLVHEYLTFNNYPQTLALLNEKQIDFHKLGRYTKNPSVPTPLINLETRPESMDDEMNEPLKIRNRIMSEKLSVNEEEILEVKRKNTEMAFEEVNNPRKFSVISNLSNVSNVPLSNLSEGRLVFDTEKLYCEEEKQEFMEVFSENEQFLQHERRQIVELIKRKKIEEAMEIMQARIPKIFDEAYLMPFMKAHIFLRMVKEESSKEAIVYSKKEKEFLKHNFSVQCPFFSSIGNRVEWRPLNTVFIAIAYNTQAECKLSQTCLDIISDEQFQVFAHFVDRLILNKMGYLSCSRLTYFASHVKKIQEKLKEFKGMNCGIELNI